MEYRQHASVGVLRNDIYYKHVCAMTDEKLRDKSEISEELAVRDMRIKELEAKLAASQAREQQLREALELVKRDARHYIPHYAFGDNEAACEMNRLLENIEGYGDEALALPQDDTALNTLLAAGQAREQQLREALEICKKEMQGDKWDALYIDGVLASK